MQRSPNNSLMKSNKLGNTSTEQTAKKHRRGNSDSLQYIGIDISNVQDLKSSIIEIEKNDTSSEMPKGPLNPQSGRTSLISFGNNKGTEILKMTM